MSWRRALVVAAWAGGNTVPVIAPLVVTSRTWVREMIRRFNEMGMDSLDRRWAGGRPRQITTDDEEFVSRVTIHLVRQPSAALERLEVVPQFDGERAQHALIATN